MLRNSLVWALCLVALVVVPGLWLGGCGGGGGGGIAVARPIVARGPITAFGSVFVGGVEYVTTGTIYNLEDNPVSPSQSDLLLGQVVTVTGEINPDGKTGHAVEIKELNELSGPVSAVSTTGLTVLGQTITVDATTQFDPTHYPTGLSGVLVGDMVEVHGLPGAANVILATRIQGEGSFTPGAQVQIRGIASSVTTTSLSIGTQGVNTTAATTSGTVVNGALVEVKGTLPAIGGIIAATSVQVEDSTLPNVGGEAQVEGVIATFTSQADFSVSGQTVNATSATFVGGTAATLAVGVRVEAEGTLQGTVLMATKVQFQ